MPSEQEGDWQVLPEHAPDWQSRLTLQRRPGPQGPQVGPPQSMSVSSPLKNVSMHAGS